MQTTPANPPVLLFDGHCAFCTRSAERLSKLTRGAVKLESFQGDGLLERFPGLTHAQCMEAMQLVDEAGRVHSGVAAAVKALEGRWFGPALKLYFLPGARQIADAGYRQIAKIRYRLGGRTNECDGESCAAHFK